MFPPTRHARSSAKRAIVFPNVRSDDGMYRLASPSDASGPNKPEVLNTSLPESFRVNTTCRAEYFTLPQKEGLLCGKKRGSSWSKEAKRKVPKKLLVVARPIFIPNLPP